MKCPQKNVTSLSDVCHEYSSVRIDQSSTTQSFFFRQLPRTTKYSEYILPLRLSRCLAVPTFCLTFRCYLAFLETLCWNTWNATTKLKWRYTPFDLMGSYELPFQVNLTRILTIHLSISHLNAWRLYGYGRNHNFSFQFLVVASLDKIRWRRRPMITLYKHVLKINPRNNSRTTFSTWTKHLYWHSAYLEKVCRQSVPFRSKWPTDGNHPTARIGNTDTVR